MTWKFKAGDHICYNWATPSWMHGTVKYVDDSSTYVAQDDNPVGEFGFGHGGDGDFHICGDQVPLEALPTKFAIGQCVERNGAPGLAGQIYDIDARDYHFHRFGRQGMTGYTFHYGITDTENLFHEVQCIDPTHKWSTPRPLPGAPPVCHEGAVRSPETCWNGSRIDKEVCRSNRWVPTGHTCPDPAPTISRLRGEVRALEVQVSDLRMKIAEMKKQYGM